MANALQDEMLLKPNAGIRRRTSHRRAIQIVLLGAAFLLSDRSFCITGANIFAVTAGALIFSLFHYIGPYGQPLRLDSFIFRTVAGLLFSGLYVTRGFGITAWTHALYDVFLAMG